jgi:hypothetical protein
MPSPYLIQRRTSTTVQAVPHRSTPIARRQQIRTSRTLIGLISSWTSRRFHRRSVRHMAMTSRPSHKTMRRPYATCLLNSAREASASSSRVVTLELAGDLASQIVALSTAHNLSPFSLHHVSLPSLDIYIRFTRYC